MNKTLLTNAVWLVLCVAAFFIGRSGPAPSAQTSERSASAPGSSTRSSSGGSESPLTEQRSARLGFSPQEVSSSFGVVLETVLAQKDPLLRTEGILSLARNLEAGQFQDAIAAFSEKGNEEDLRLLYTAWAEVAPYEALAYAKENADGNSAAQTILATFAKTDPDGAIAWAKKDFDGDDDRRANPYLIGVINGLALVDVPRATALLQELPYSRGRGRALDAIYDEISKEGTQQAKDWISSLTEERLQAGAARKLVEDLAKNSPEEAAEWVSSLGDEALSSAAGSIVEKWAEADLTAAKTWVERQDPAIIASAGPSLVREMAAKDQLLEASKWVAQYEGSPDFDRTIRSLVRSSASQEPEFAADWALRITSERERARTLHRMLGSWLEKDQAGAKAFLDSQSIPDSVRRRLDRRQN